MPRFHHPHPFCFALGLLDLVQKTAERGAIAGIAVHHFVGQRETIPGDRQSYHHRKSSSTSSNGFSEVIVSNTSLILSQQALPCGAKDLSLQHVTVFSSNQCGKLHQPGSGLRGKRPHEGFSSHTSAQPTQGFQHRIARFFASVAFQALSAGNTKI
jgi:hypothetical protein